MAETISLQCPKCSARLKAGVALLGKTLPCPQCKIPINVTRGVPSDADVKLIEWSQVPEEVF